MKSFILCLFTIWSIPNLVYGQAIRMDGVVPSGITKPLTLNSTVAVHSNGNDIYVTTGSVSTDRHAFHIEGTSGNLGIGNTAPDGLLEIGDGTMTVLSNGNVGIGLTAPTERLSVFGNMIFSATGDATIDGPVNSDLILNSRANGVDEGIRFTMNDIEKVTFLKDGNVGIGVVDPVALLEVGDTSFVSTAPIVRVSSANGTGILEVDSSGNVGVGTTAPTQRLSVYPGSDSLAHIGRAHVGQGWYADTAAFMHEDMVTGTQYALAQEASGATSLNSKSGQPITFKVANGQQGIFQSGNFGIGPDTTPDAKLHVNESPAVGDLVRVSSGSSVYVTVTDAGNMGIGTTAPTYKLYVTSTIYTTTALAVGQAPGSYALSINGTSHLNGNVDVDQYIRRFSDPNTYLNFSVDQIDITAGAITMFSGKEDNPNSYVHLMGSSFTVLQNGNVGISTTIPVAKFAVDGNAVFIGTVTASTFNAVGSAYMVDGVEVIDANRNIYAGTRLRIAATGDCSTATPGAAGELCMEHDNESQTLWASTSTSNFFPLANHGTSGCEGRFAMSLSSTNASVTTINVATTFVTMNGTFVTTPTYNHDFSFSGATATYTGTGPHWFAVNLDATVQLTAKDKDVAIVVVKNNVPTKFSYKSIRIAKEVTGWPASTSDVVTLSNGDTISVKVKNKTDTMNILCKEVMLRIEQKD